MKIKNNTTTITPSVSLNVLPTKKGTRRYTPPVVDVSFTRWLKPTQFPEKAGVYAIRYHRAKSKNIQVGAAYYGGKRNGWNSTFIGSKGLVSPVVNSRTFAVTSPMILEWSQIAA